MVSSRDPRSTWRVGVVRSKFVADSNRVPSGELIERCDELTIVAIRLHPSLRHHTHAYHKSRLSAQARGTTSADASPANPNSRSLVEPRPQACGHQRPLSFRSMPALPMRLQASRPMEGTWSGGETIVSAKGSTPNEAHQ